MTYLFIFLGSGLGGALRYFISTSLHKISRISNFPIGTFSVNIIGCFLIGFLAHFLADKGFSAHNKTFFLIGLLGGFTTFSSFNYETLSLLKDGQYFFAFANALLQVAIGLGAVWLGTVIARFV